MKKIVITAFLLFVGTGMLSTASAERILDFGVISQANGFIYSDFSIDKEGNGITSTPVSDGMIAASNSITEPGTAFLLGSGIISLVGLKRKKFAKRK